MSTRKETMGRVLAVAVLTAMAVGLTPATAHADWRYDRDHRYDHRDWRAEEWRRHHRQYYGDRVYVAPPPPVYYAPPPPPPGLNLFFHVR